MPRTFRLSAVLAAAVLAVPAWAQLSGRPPEDAFRTPDSLLDGSAHERHSQISAYGVTRYGAALGLAGRYTLPILKDGFIPELNDSVEIEAGGDFIFPTFGVNPALVVLAAEPRWTFHFNPQFESYLKIGIGGFIPLGPTNLSPVTVLAAIGAGYKVNGSLWIRAEISNFVGSVGVGLEF